MMYLKSNACGTFVAAFTTKVHSGSTPALIKTSLRNKISALSSRAAKGTTKEWTPQRTPEETYYHWLHYVFAANKSTFVRVHIWLRIKARVSVLYGDLMHAGIWKNTREVPEARREAECFWHFSSVLSNSQVHLISIKHDDKCFNSFIRWGKHSGIVRSKTTISSHVKSGDHCSCIYFAFQTRRNTVREKFMGISRLYS